MNDHLGAPDSILARDTYVAHLFRNFILTVYVCAFLYLNLFPARNNMPLGIDRFYYGLINGFLSIIWAYGFISTTQIFDRRPLRVSRLEVIVGVLIIISVVLAHIQIHNIHVDGFWAYWPSLISSYILAIVIFILFKKLPDERLKVHSQSTMPEAGSELKH